MNRIEKVIACTLCCLMWAFAPGVSAEEPPAPASPEQTLAAMVDAWERGGEPALREYVRQNRQTVSGELIVDLANSGRNERSDPRLSETRLSMAIVAAHETADKHAEAEALRIAGDYYVDTSEHEKALGYYDKALPLYEEQGDLKRQGDVYWKRGNIYFRSGDSTQALAMYEKALPFFEKTSEPVGQGNVYWRRGDIYFRTGDSAQALAMYEKALPFYEKADDSKGQGNVYFRRGEIYFIAGDNGQALAMYEKALPFYEKVDDPVGQGIICLRRGDLYFYTGDTARALAMYEKALPFFEKTQNLFGQGNLYKARGDIYFYAGDTGQALAMYEKALPFFEKVDDPVGQGNVYLSRGDLYLTTGDNTRALAMYEKALPFFEKTENPYGQGNLYLSRGDIYRDTGDNAQALAMYEKALSFFEKANDPRGEGDVCKNRGDLYFHAGDKGQALAMYEKAMWYFMRGGDPAGQGDVLIAKSEVYARQGRKAEALSGYEQALGLLEKVRRQTGIEELKRSYLEKVYDSYDSAAQFMLASGYRDKAFRVAESMKARLFLDRLAEGLVDLEKGIAPELKQRRDGLESRLGALRTQRKEAYGERSPEAEKLLADLGAQIDAAEKELDEIRTEIRLKNPLYASVEYSEIVSVPEVREKILRPGEALVEYYLGERDAWCFVLSRKAFDVVKLPAAATEIRDTVGRCVARRQAREALRLYEVLIAPIESRLKGKSLIIVPDGALARLPFELLQKKVHGSPRFLIELHPVAYTQSATVLAFYRTRYHREGTSDSFIGFGDPVYDYESYSADKPERGAAVAGDTLAASAARRGLEHAGLGLTRLPGSGAEVAAIGSLFTGAGKSGTTLLRADAREEHVKEPGMSGYRYIHLAAHGILDDTWQAIALAQVPGASEDGMLTLGEIMNLRFDASLVVLSACRTGLGKISRGEGVTGLTRAVMYAGSPAALVSLWSVSDEGTRELMTRFYGSMLRDHLAPGEALRRAKLEMIADPKWRDPFLWAAFVLYGE